MALTVFFLLCLLGTYGQLNVDVSAIIACTDCVVTPVLGGGSFSGSKIMGLWALTYTLLQPSVRLSYSNGADIAMNKLLEKCKKVYAYDYAVETYLPDLDTNSSFSDIIALPFFFEAVAIVYNLGLDSSVPPLNLSRSVISRIYQQDITYWNHTDIRALNTNAVALAALGNQTITLVLRLDPNGVTRTLLEFLNSVDPGNWSTDDIGLVFPKRLKNATNGTIVFAKDQFSAASYVLTTPGACGFAPYNLVDDAGLPQARIKNKAGVYARADNKQLQAAVAALNITGPSKRAPIDAPGNTSYPLTAMTYQLFHKTTRDCETYRAMLRFWHWCLTDSFAQALIDGMTGYMGLTPELTAYSVNVLKNFECGGEKILDEFYVDAQLSILRQAMICVSGICMMFTLSVIATLSYKRRSRITKAAGLAFAICFLLGCICNYLSIFFWAVGAESDSICQARYSFAVLGYTLILGAMFSKSWEINKVFTAGETGVVNPFQEVPWWQFCRVFFSIVSIQALLLLVWIVVDGPTTVVTVIDPINFIAIRDCTVMHPKIWLSLEIIYFSLLLVWGAYLAYETRDVWLKYNYPNESRSILLSIYNLAFCGIILVPLITTLEVSYETLFFLVAIAILWPTSFALFSVYMPKLAKFLGSSYRNSGNSQKGQMSGDKAERSHSVPSAIKAATEKDQEQKLLNAHKKEHPDPESPVRPHTPVYESPRKGAEPDSPDSRVRRFGTERTESTEEIGTWRTLLTASSTDDVHAVSENTV